MRIERMDKRVNVSFVESPFFEWRIARMLEKEREITNLGQKLTLMRSHLSMSGHKLYCTQTLLHRLKDAPFATDTDKHTNIPTLSIALTASTVHRYPSLICTFHVR